MKYKNISMKKTSPEEPNVVVADQVGQELSIIDDYFSKQSPLAQLVEIKGAFLKMLHLVDDMNAQIMKVNRRTANTNSRLSVLEGRLRGVVEDLAYYDIQLDREKE